MMRLRARTHTRATMDSMYILYIITLHTTTMRMIWDSQKQDKQAELNVPAKSYDRVRSSELYHTSRWTKLSKAFRSSHALCEECKKRGVIKPATCVDHITPWPICGERGFFDRANLQALCDECNADKGRRQQKEIQLWKAKHPGWNK